MSGILGLDRWREKQYSSTVCRWFLRLTGNPVTLSHIYFRMECNTFVVLDFTMSSVGPAVVCNEYIAGELPYYTRSCKNEDGEDEEELLDTNELLMSNDDETNHNSQLDSRFSFEPSLHVEYGVRRNSIDKEIFIEFWLMKRFCLSKLCSEEKFIVEKKERNLKISGISNICTRLEDSWLPLSNRLLPQLSCLPITHTSE